MHVVTSVPSTVSVADAVNVATAPPALVASTSTSPDVVTVGGKSRTVTVSVAVPPLPCPSVAVHVTIVAPTANIEPDAGAQSGATAPSTRSDADAVNVATAP